MTRTYRSWTGRHRSRRAGPSRIRLRAGSSVAFILLLLLGLTSCDINGNIGSKGLGCGPSAQAAGNARPIAADNSDHGFYADGLTAGVHNAMTYAIGQINTTHVDPHETTTLSAQTDVQMLDNSYTNYCGWPWYGPHQNGLGGLTTCAALNSDNECEQHEVRINTNLTGETGVTDGMRENLVLHEAGHTLGLVHVSDRSDVMCDPPNLLTVTLSTRNKKAINGYYK